MRTHTRTPKLAVLLSAMVALSVGCGGTNPDVGDVAPIQAEDGEGDTTPDPDGAPPEFPELPEPGTELTATLTWDTESCRNDGTATTDVAEFDLVDAVPADWTSGEASGTVTVETDVDGVFIASDGTRLAVTVGPTDSVCESWDDA